MASALRKLVFGLTQSGRTASVISNGWLGGITEATGSSCSMMDRDVRHVPTACRRLYS